MNISRRGRRGSGETERASGASPAAPSSTQGEFQGQNWTQGGLPAVSTLPPVGVGRGDAVPEKSQSWAELTFGTAGVEKGWVSLWDEGGGDRSGERESRGSNCIAWLERRCAA